MPLPSSPHWAPIRTIAGMAFLPRSPLIVVQPVTYLIRAVCEGAALNTAAVAVLLFGSIGCRPLAGCAYCRLPTRRNRCGGSRPSAAGGRRRRCRSRGRADAAVASRAARCRGRLRVATALVRYAGISDTGGSPSGPPGAARFGAAGAADPRRDRNGDRRERPAGAPADDAQLLHGEAVVDDAVLFDGDVAEVRIEPTATLPGLRARASGAAVAGRAGRPAGHHGCSRGPRRCAGAPGGAPIDVLSQHRGLVVGPVSFMT